MTGNFRIQWPHTNENQHIYILIFCMYKYISCIYTYMHYLYEHMTCNLCIHVRYYLYFFLTLTITHWYKGTFVSYMHKFCMYAQVYIMYTYIHASYINTYDRQSMYTIEECRSSILWHMYTQTDTCIHRLPVIYSCIWYMYVCIHMG